MFSVEHVKEVAPVPQERRRFRRVKLSGSASYMLKVRRRISLPDDRHQPRQRRPRRSRSGSDRICASSSISSTSGGSRALVVRRPRERLRHDHRSHHNESRKSSPPSSLAESNRQAFGLPEDRRHDAWAPRTRTASSPSRTAGAFPAIIVDLLDLARRRHRLRRMIPLGAEVTIGHREAPSRAPFRHRSRGRVRPAISSERFNRGFEL